MRGFLASLRQDFRSGVPLIVWLTASVVMVISGPFGSYATFTFAERLVYWPLILALGVLISVGIRAYVYGGLGWSQTARGSFLTAFLVATVLTPLLLLAIRSSFHPSVAGFVGVGEIYLMIASISLGVCSLRVAVSPKVDLLVEEAAEPAMPRLMKRIAPELQGELWAISVRDHYVDVQTSRGKMSLLMRFSDAIAEAETVAGAQVHRSHWVAWEGVESVSREASKVTLLLKSGQQIPVSRNHRDKVDARFPPGSETVRSVAA